MTITRNINKPNSRQSIHILLYVIILYDCKVHYSAPQEIKENFLTSGFVLSFVLESSFYVPLTYRLLIMKSYFGQNKKKMFPVHLDEPNSSLQQLVFFYLIDYIIKLSIKYGTWIKTVITNISFIKPILKCIYSLIGTIK